MGTTTKTDIMATTTEIITTTRDNTVTTKENTPDMIMDITITDSSSTKNGANVADTRENVAVIMADTEEDATNNNITDTSTDVGDTTDMVIVASKDAILMTVVVVIMAVLVVVMVLVVDTVVVTKLESLGWKGIEKFNEKVDSANYFGQIQLFGAGRFKGFVIILL